MLETADGLELATYVELLGSAEEVLDARVGVIVAAEDLLGLLDPARSTSVSVCRIEPLRVATYLSGR